MIHIEKGEIKLSVLIGGMIACIENPKESTINLLRQISEFNKNMRYKVNILINHIYISNEELETKTFKNTI